MNEDLRLWVIFRQHLYEKSKESEENIDYKTYKRNHFEVTKIEEILLYFTGK